MSVVHIVRGQCPGLALLDGRQVKEITAFLFHTGGDDDPAKLRANADLSFQGSIVLGMGFTFDDTDTTGVATPLAEMRRLIDDNPRNQEVIFPYIGGEEVNASPTHAHQRYVINFGERDEGECRRSWSELVAIVEEKVKPERVVKDATKYPRMVNEWWKFWNPRPELRSAIGGMNRALVCARHQLHWSVAFMPTRCVFSDALIVFALPSYSCFAALQSRPHEIWARFFGSTLEDRLRYTPSDCFETFPFPENWREHPVLEEVGQTYYEFRAKLMVDNNEGLTKTYNRFHDPEERDPRIARLRELHDAMDRAVLDAYGWTDIRPTCEFILDYEIDEEGWGRKKKPYRYRWPDDIRDEVLGRLLELNKKRAEEERLSGLAAHRGRGTARTRPAEQLRQVAEGSLPLLEHLDEDGEQE